MRCRRRCRSSSTRVRGARRRVSVHRRLPSRPSLRVPSASCAPRSPRAPISGEKLISKRYLAVSASATIASVDQEHRRGHRDDRAGRAEISRRAPFDVKRLPQPPGLGGDEHVRDRAVPLGRPRRHRRARRGDPTRVAAAHRRRARAARELLHPPRRARQRPTAEAPGSTSSITARHPSCAPRDPQRLAAGLCQHLAAFLPASTDGLLIVNGVALVGERGAVIAPAPLRQWMSAVERRLNVRGVRVVDAPWVLVDVDTNEVVVPDPAAAGLAIDGDAFGALDELAPASRADPAVGVGRYPLGAWAFIGDGTAMTCRAGSRVRIAAHQQHDRAPTPRSTRWRGSCGPRPRSASNGPSRRSSPADSSRCRRDRGRGG